MGGVVHEVDQGVVSWYPGEASGWEKLMAEFFFFIRVNKKNDFRVVLSEWRDRLEDASTDIVKSCVSVPFVDLEADEKDSIAVPAGVLEVLCEGLTSV